MPFADAALAWEGGHDPLGRARSGAAGRVLRAPSGSTPGGGWSFRAWSTATPTSPSAAGGRTNSSSASEGASYLEIARAGGGIARTVRQTRAAADDELLAPRARVPRARCWRSASPPSSARAATGSTASTSCELLRVYRRLAQAAADRGSCRPFSARTWCRRSIAIDREAYVALLIDELIPAVARERLARVLRRVRRGVGLQRGRGPADPARAGARRASRRSCTPIS